MPTRESTPPRTSPPLGTLAPGTQYKRGARPSPRHKLLSAMPFTGTVAPAQFAIVPARLDAWGNLKHGDCVTAEEAFAKACHTPEIFITADEVIAWATAHGVLEGADLPEVMTWMQTGGFVVGNQAYDDGPHAGVDYSNESVLRSAIAQGNVKIAIDANALPSTAGNQQGWYATGGGNFPNTDHCISICGYGPAGWLYQQLGVSLPGSLTASQQGYLVFTWATIGFVDHNWIMRTCVEAWVRNPTTIGVPPLPDPIPPTPPVPPIPPIPPVPPTPPPDRPIVRMLKAEATLLIRYYGKGVVPYLIMQIEAMSRLTAAEKIELMIFIDGLAGKSEAEYGKPPPAGAFLDILAKIRELIAEYGPAALPAVLAMIDASPLPAWEKMLLEALVSRLVATA